MSVRSVVVALVAAATVVVQSCVSEEPDCEAVYARWLEDSGLRGPAPDGGGGTGGEAVAAGRGSQRVPVGEIGDWVIRTPAGGVVLVEDGRPTSVCGSAGTPERPPMTAPGAGTPSFTDSDLRGVVGGSPSGVVVYVWSPHMPLSVDGYAEVAGAAEERGLTVVALRFAESDADFARREARRAGLPASALREVASAELLLRDAQLHAPSVIVFQEDDVSPVMPGYRNAEGYGRWLDAFLNRRDPPSDTAR